MFFFCFGGGEREDESEAKKGGGVLFIWNREGGRVFEEGKRGGAQRGSEGVAVGRRGGANFFLFGAEIPKDPAVLKILRHSKFYYA